MSGRLPPWTPFGSATVIEKPWSQEETERVAKQFGMTPEAVLATIADLRKDQIFLNSRYQVHVRRLPGKDTGDGTGWPEMIHLSIRRLDRERPGKERYRDFLRIKNELVGPDHEAVELYPAMSRNVDTANQYHLFVLADPKLAFPFGFRDGCMSTDSIGGSKNAEFEED